MPTSFQPESFLILIVEDDQLTRMLLRQYLTHAGYQVAEATNGEECLELYQQVQPHLVLLDAMMPKMNGFDCCSKLLSLPGAVHSPVIMITGLDDTASVDWAFDAGATDYVTKPIHWPILRRRVRILLEKGFFYRELEQANHQLREMATTDKLTSLGNRRYFDDCLEREWKSAIRYRHELSLILCDVDRFKQYNDFYGHPAGDICLQKIAGMLSKAAKRATDVVARYGGEEFALLLPNTGSEGAMRVAHNLQAAIRMLAIPHAGSASHQVTVSQGIASIIPTPQERLSDLISFADRALYQAKTEGRDRIIVIDLTGAEPAPPA
ncbi:MAG: diguanylate cyclase [Synechococcales bacterium]|nr:diguanylate cyclase [Synechococcales bacterium]